MVGVVEIAAGILVALRPQIGGYVVAAWLAGHHRQPAADPRLLRRRVAGLRSAAGRSRAGPAGRRRSAGRAPTCAGASGDRRPPAAPAGPTAPATASIARCGWCTRGQVDLAAAERAAAAFLAALGVDVDTEKPARARRAGWPAAYAEMLTPRAFDLTTFPNDEGYDELVLARSIPVRSVCEHHLLPFVGVAHVGYLPGRPHPRAVQAGPGRRAVRPPARRCRSGSPQQVADWLQTQLAPARRRCGHRGRAPVHDAARRPGRPARARVTSALLGTLRDDAAVPRRVPRPRRRQPVPESGDHDDHDDFVDRRRRPGRRQGRRDPARRGLRRRGRAASATSRSDPTSGRRCPRATCSAPPTRDESSSTPRLVRRARRRAAHRQSRDARRPRRAGRSSWPTAATRRLRPAAAGHRLVAAPARPPRCRPRRRALPAHARRRRPHRATPRRGRQRGDRRRRLDRPGGRRRRPAPRRRGHRRRDGADCRCSGCSATRSARVFADLHREHGVDLPLRRHGRASSPASGTVDRRRLGDGTESRPTLVVVGVGITAQRRAGPRRPAWTSTTASLVDARLRTVATRTSSPPATSPTPTTRCSAHRLRVEHWANALNGGPAAARSMLGQRRRLRPAAVLLHRPVRPRAWSTPATSSPAAYDRGRLPRRPGGRRVHRVLARGGRVLAGMNVNVWDAVPATRP